MDSCGIVEKRIIVTCQSQSVLEVKILDGCLRKTEITLVRHWEMICEGTWMSCRKGKRRWDSSRSVRMLKTLKITVWIGRWWWEGFWLWRWWQPSWMADDGYEMRGFLCRLSISSFSYGWSLRCPDTAKILDLGICQFPFFPTKFISALQWHWLRLSRGGFVFVWFP